MNFTSAVGSSVISLEKEKAHTIYVKVSLTLQNSKPLKDNFPKNKQKSLKELQPDKSLLILLADKGRSNVIFYVAIYLRKILLPK